MPYTELMTLAKELSDAINEGSVQHDRTSMADILVSLPDSCEEETRDNIILTQFFSRKKQLTIQPHGDAFKITCPTVEGAIVFSEDIRAGLSQLLDTLTVLQALE